MLERGFGRIVGFGKVSTRYLYYDISFPQKSSPFAQAAVLQDYLLGGALCA